MPGRRSVAPFLGRSAAGVAAKGRERHPRAKTLVARVRRERDASRDATGALTAASPLNLASSGTKATTAGGDVACDAYLSALFPRERGARRRGRSERLTAGASEVHSDRAAAAKWIPAFAGMTSSAQLARRPSTPGDVSAGRAFLGGAGPRDANLHAAASDPGRHPDHPSAYSAAYTCLPPTQVCSTRVFQMSAGGPAMMSRSIRMKSAHLPVSSVPSVFSACSA